MCVLRRMFGARMQVCSVVRWLFGCGLVGLSVVVIVPLFLSFLAMPGLINLLLSPCTTAPHPPHGLPHTPPKYESWSPHATSSDRL